MKQKFYWTDEKIEELKSMSTKESPYKLAIYFHTTTETIVKKIEELGLESYKTNRWTKEEEQLLIEYSKKYLTKTIARKLGRSYVAVQKKAIKLGIELHSEIDPWKKWMIDYLKENINKKPIGEIEKMLGISYRRILTKCNELGIEYVKEDWTEEEINILREYADKCHYTELVKVLPNRSVGAITAKAYELGIKTISEHHKLDDSTAQYIKENWGKLPATQIARNLKISTGVVYRYKKELNLPNVGQQKKWTKEVVENLREDAKTKNRTQLAKKYKTSEEQISYIANKNEIKLIDGKRIWNEELDKKLLGLVDKNLTIDEISQQLQIKTCKIRKHLKELKIEKYSKSPRDLKKWTEEEINFLREMSLTLNIKEIADRLGKTERQIYSKARQLGIKINSGKKYLWTDEETKMLIELSQIYDRHMIAKVMHRDESVIKDKAYELGITLRIRERKNWTTEEEQQLEMYVENFTEKEIAYLLNRSQASVGSKLKYMGIKAQSSTKFWTEEEYKQLKELVKEHSIEEIATIMGKSYESIINKTNQMALKVFNKYYKVWTTEEEQELQELLTTYSPLEISKILNRSEESIISKAVVLGYKISEKHKKWTEEEEILLSDLWGNKPIEYISKKLNRSISSIKNRVFLLGLGSQIENNYDGLTIPDISDIFNVNRNVILTSWVSLGLKLNFRRRSNQNVYAYVKIEDLYEFLEQNQNIWDSRNLEDNILGKEPDWLKEKRKKDEEKDLKVERLNLTKQQLILAKNYYLNSEEQNNENQIDNEEKNTQLVKKKNNIK